MSPRRVVLLTATYPWAPGEEFIAPELSHWVRVDADVTIMPWRTSEQRRDIPAGLAVDTRLDVLRRSQWRRSLARQLVNPSVWAEILTSLRSGIRSPGALWRIAVPAAAAHLTSKALRSFAREHGKIDVAYSYWFDYQCLGALRARDVVGAVASRAHGYDLYEERSIDGRLPFRRAMVHEVDLIAPISTVGLTYLRDRYQAPSSTSTTYHLGVAIHDGAAPAPRSLDPVRLISISSLTDVKRINLLIDTLAALAKRRPGRRIEWSHAGDGPLAAELHRAADALPEQVSVTWLGHLAPAELTAVLDDGPWHFAVNTSSSEGVPVSLMEAMERAIPIAATQVGATAELVKSPGGILLEPDGTPQEWALAIDHALPRTLDPDFRAGFRAEVIANWNQGTNLGGFVDAVLALA